MSSTTANNPLRSRALRSRIAVALLAASAFAYAPHARADGDKALAESLFQAGKDLMAQKKYDEACPKFADSQKADPSAGRLLNLARCHEDAGKTASAWAEYKAAATMARTSGQTDRETAAKDFAAKLEPNLSKLEIDGPTDITGLDVKRDGVSIGAASLGLALAVDPGDHLIEVSAPGFKPWSTRVTVGPTKDVQKVAIPVLEKAPDTGADTGTPGTPGATPSSGTQRTAGFVVGGVGVVGVALGAIFGIVASGKKPDATACPDKKCITGSAGSDALSSAKSAATISTVGFIGGGVLLAAGAILIATSPSKKKAEAPTAFHVIPEAGPQGGGLTLLGKF